MQPTETGQRTISLVPGANREKVPTNESSATPFSKTGLPSIGITLHTWLPMLNSLSMNGCSLSMVPNLRTTWSWRFLRYQWSVLFSFIVSLLTATNSAMNTLTPSALVTRQCHSQGRNALMAQVSTYDAKDGSPSDRSLHDKALTRQEKA